jgi:hypothetical protein
MSIKKLRVNYIVILIAIIGIALLGAQHSSQSAASKKELEPADVEILNKTRGFEVTVIEKVGGKLWQITFKNSYDKTITAFQASFGDTTLYEELIVESNKCIGCILPGATYVRFFPAIRNLTIFAVVFEDGTGEGDPSMMKEVIDIREGKAKAMREFVSRVQKVMVDSSPLTEELDNLKREFADSSTIDDTISSDERYGFESGRTELLEELNGLKKEGAAKNDTKIRLRSYAEDLQRFSQRLGKHKRL